MKKQNKNILTILAILAGALIILNIVGVININNLISIYKSNNDCSLDSNNGILECGLTDASAIADVRGNTIVIDFLGASYSSFIKSHPNSVAMLYGVDRHGNSVNELGLCTVSGDNLNCANNLYDVSLGKETSITVYFSNDGITQISDLCMNKGEEKCNDKQLSVCEMNEFVNKGLVLGKCGIECLTNTNCQNQNNILNNVCMENNIVKIISNGTCNLGTNKCQMTNTTQTISSCKLGCANGQCFEETQNVKISFYIVAIIIILSSILIFWIIRRKRGRR